jgi:hypothetical protein
MFDEFLVERLAPMRRVGFLGLAKNTGKTTAFNYVSGVLHHRGERCGLITTGRDGEATDLLYGNPKSPVEVMPLQLLVTTVDEAARSTADLRPIGDTPFTTSVGRLRTFEVIGTGRVVLVGPVTCAELVTAIGSLLAGGCRRILVDGSINRKAFARPGVVDGIVACTGAALSEDIDLLVEKTVDGLAPFRDPGGASLRRRPNAASTPVASATPAAEHEIEVTGAFTDEAAERLLQEGFSGTVIVRDATRVFLDWYTRRRLEDAGVRIEPKIAVPLVFVCVNPTSPTGCHFDSEALLDRLGDVLPDLPIVDIKTCRHRFTPS